MKALKVIGGLAVLAAFGAGYYWLRSNDVRLPVDEPRILKLPAGQPVNLIVVEPLSSGGSEVGEEVDLIVAEDVKVDGTVAIRKGTPAKGKITRSRSGSIVSALSNQPARLEMELTSIQADGKTIPIVPAEADVHAFTQANTARKEPDADIEEAMKDPEKRKLLEDVVSRLAGKEKVSATDLVGLDLEALNDSFTLPETDRFLNEVRNVRPGAKSGESSRDSAERIIGGLVSGRLTDVAGIDPVVIARALGEVGNLGRKADQKLRGVFKGRNIWVEIGTPVPAKTAKLVEIRK